MRMLRIHLRLIPAIVLAGISACATGPQTYTEPGTEQEVKVERASCIDRVPDDAYTEEQLSVLLEILQLNDNGTIQPVDESRGVLDQLALSPLEVGNMNMAIGEINESVIYGYFIVEPDFSNVAIPILLAAKGYWWCVGKVLKCELLSVGCIAAAPACVATCAGVCTGTLGFGCIACIAACGAGGIALCDSAYDCWVEADEAGCIP